MTKEDIRQAAQDCLNESMVWKPHSSYEDAILNGFYEGEDWAQKQMQESNEGQALLYAVEKTAERTKKEMIEKAVKWMYNYFVIDHYDMTSAGFGLFELAFKQAMQDESK